MIEESWRGDFSDEEVDQLHAAAFHHAPWEGRWRSNAERLSLGWATARSQGQLVGFLNVPWDGDGHAWLQDVIVAPEHQRAGVGTRMVEMAASEAARAGCEWLHVDFDPEHRSFYLHTCGFEPAEAGLRYLR